MEFLDSIRVLRRRWLIIVAGLVLGLVAGWLSAPGESGPVTYAATHTLIVNPTTRQAVNLEQAALLATTGPVPVRTAQKLNVTRGAVTGHVTALADSEVGSVTVTARETDADLAEALANTTAAELLAELGGTSLEAYQDQLNRLNEQVDRSRVRVSAAEGAGSSPAAVAELRAAQGELSTAINNQQTFLAQGAPQSPLRSVELAQAHRADPEGVEPPKSKPGRAALLGFFGLLLGVGAALALDRLDTRIHSKRSAEAAFGYPVVAEIPRLPRSGANELLALSKPASAFVEAFRGLRTVLALANLDGDDDGHRVIVVTSPLAGEGKTTTVAHLAAMLSEIGRTVVVISADLRRPRLHLYFDREREPGLTDWLGRSSPDDLRSITTATKVRGVRFLASGAPVENPAPLLDDAVKVVLAARDAADFVLIDTPPLLVANDAVTLAQAADGVLILARSGRTTIDAAERSREVLERLEVPVVGVVVTNADDTPSAYGYYRNRYYAESEKKRFRLFRDRDRPASGGNGKAAKPAGSVEPRVDAARR